MIKKDFIWNVYLIKCSDGKIYTGCTNDLQRRMAEHSSGKVSFTSTRLPVALVFYCSFSDKYKAFDFEKYLKSGSGKAFAQKRFL